MGLMRAQLTVVQIGSVRFMVRIACRFYHGQYLNPGAPGPLGA